MSVETNDGTPNRGTFPPEWGRPPGTRMSQERALWVTTNVARGGWSARAALRRVQDERMRDLTESIRGLLAKRDRRP